MVFFIVEKITNVTHVKKHFLKQETSRCTLIQFIMVKKITNVKTMFCCNIYISYFEEDFIKATMITTVNVVAHYFVKCSLRPQRLQL